MLIAIGLFLFSLFGGSAGIRDRLEDTVSDPVRLEAAIERLDGIEELQELVETQIEQSAAAFRAVHADYNATREDYLATLEPLREARMELGQRLRQGWLDMHEILTDEEWAEVFPAAD